MGLSQTPSLVIFRLARCAALLSTLAALSGCRRPIAGLDAPEQLTLYSIDGRDFPQGKEPKANERFHRYPVLGKVEISDPSQRDEIARALKGGLSRHATEASPEFRPRHAIRTVEKGRTVDYLICFQCDQLIAYVDGHPQRQGVTKDAESLFDKQLATAKVPLTPE